MDLVTFPDILLQAGARAAALLWQHAWQLLLFAIVLMGIEALWPAVPTQGRWRRGSATDLWLSFINPLIVHPFNAYLLAAFVNGAIAAVGMDRFIATRETVAAQPWAIQFVAALLVGDLLSYWKHRIFHTRLLWRVHAVHHLTSEIDWLSNDRDHPLQLIATYFIMITGLVLVGFSNEMIALQALVRRAYSLFTHANVRWSFGPLARILVSPCFHRWHHASEEGLANRNFSVVFSFWDVAFGTYHDDAAEQPRRFGVAGEENPATLWAAMKYPLTP